MLGPLLQVQANQAVVSEDVASKMRARLLWIACGFAALMLCAMIGVSAGAIPFSASHASAKPPHLSPDVAFNPTLPALRPGIGGAHPTALRPAALPGMRQGRQQQPTSGPRMSGTAGGPVGEQVSRRAALLAAAAASMLPKRASAGFKLTPSPSARSDKPTPGSVLGLSGTATERLEAARDRARSLNGKMTGDWEDIRKQLLFAAGLADVDETSYCFTDFNHVAATTMRQAEQENLQDGNVQGPSMVKSGNVLGGAQENGLPVVNDPGKWLGPVIKSASLREGKGFENDGSWCTSALGALKVPPLDVAHTQFKSEVAFYLVWIEGSIQFALVTEQGEYLAGGQPTAKSATLPSQDARSLNWKIFTEDEGGPRSPTGKIAQAALRGGLKF